MFADFIDQLLDGYFRVHSSYPSLIVMKKEVYDKMKKEILDRGDMFLSWADIETPNYKGILVDFHDLEEVILK